MFKKFTALILITAFTHVYAVTPVQQTFTMADEMDRSFNELNYRVNVEWDQADSKYLTNAMNDFEK